MFHLTWDGDVHYYCSSGWLVKSARVATDFCLHRILRVVTVDVLHPHDFKYSSHSKHAPQSPKTLAILFYTGFETVQWKDLAKIFKKLTRTENTYVECHPTQALRTKSFRSLCSPCSVHCCIRCQSFRVSSPDFGMSNRPKIGYSPRDWG